MARLGRERFAFVDMADIASGGALRDVEACLGLPAHAYASAQLHAPSSNAGSRAADPVAAAPAAVVRFLAPLLRAVEQPDARIDWGGR